MEAAEDTAETQELQRQIVTTKEVGRWKTMLRGLQQRRERITKKVRRDVGQWGWKTRL